MSPAWKRFAVACFVALGMTQGPAACFSRVEDPSKETGALIDKCTTEARDAYYVAGRTIYEAGHIYDDCIRRGLDGGAP